ncbi:MAG: hypothetical protein WA139_03585 [Candidatus Aenigmatarchaeota archaeon]
MSSQFKELMAREDFVEKEGYVTPQKVSDLSGNPVSYEKDLLSKLVKAGRIARVELHFPSYPSDGFGDNSITYFLRTDLFRKIQQEERKPESPETHGIVEYKEVGKVRHYFRRGYPITVPRWKNFVEGKEGFLIPGAIRC